jgi:mono/diheme cytochrome c family protein
MRRLIPYLVGATLALAACGVGGLAVVQFGLFDVRASTPHSPVVAWATHTTMIHAVQKDAAGLAPLPPLTQDEARAGFALYDRDCVTCHGAPGIARAPWVDGLTPSPPYLVDAPRHWTARQLYFIVANGVKMTAMPAWSTVHSPAELRQLVAFLEAQPNLTQRDYLALRAAANAPAAPAAPAPGP